jgi:hypothetical protein
VSNQLQDERRTDNRNVPNVRWAHPLQVGLQRKYHKRITAGGSTRCGGTQRGEWVLLILNILLVAVAVAGIVTGT